MPTKRKGIIEGWKTKGRIGKKREMPPKQPLSALHKEALSFLNDKVKEDEDRENERFCEMMLERLSESRMMAKKKVDKIDIDWLAFHFNHTHGLNLDEYKKRSRIRKLLYPPEQYRKQKKVRKINRE